MFLQIYEYQPRRGFFGLELGIQSFTKRRFPEKESSVIR